MSTEIVYTQKRGRKPKHRLAPAKIPIELNDQFEAAKAATGDTHTQAVETAIGLYVKSARRRIKGASEVLGTKDRS